MPDRPDRPCPVEPSPFNALDAAFRLLCASPDPLAVPAGAVPGLPGRPVPLDELKARLLHPSCPHSLRAAAVGWLLGRARDQRGPWLVGLAGMLLPGLRVRVAGLIGACPGKTQDIEAEALAGLLEAIGRTEPSHPRAAARLCWLARNRARRLVRAELAEAARPGAHPISAEPPRPYGHPDLVLVRAVAAGVVCADDAALIGDTRLGLLDLPEAAELLGVDYKTAHQRRRRAEAALAAWINDGADDGPADRRAAPAAGRFVENGAARPCSTGGGRPRTGRDPDRRPAVRHPLPTHQPRR